MVNTIFKAESTKKLGIALKKTTSRKKRRKLFTDIHQEIDCNPYLLDKFIDYALKNNLREPTEFLEKLANSSRNIKKEIPVFLKRNAEEFLLKINSEIINFYQNDKHYNNNGLAQRIQEMNNEGKIIFEYPLYDSATSFWYVPKYFSKKIKEPKPVYYDYRDFAEIADAIILYHGTSNIFDENIKNGLQPPVATKNELIVLEDYENYLRDDITPEELEKFRESYEATRKYSVYFSTARLSSIDQKGIFTNGDVDEYMMRAERKYGGEGKLYVCIVPTDRLLPDEDAGKTKDWIESIYKMNSAKIDGGLEKENVFCVKNNNIPHHTIDGGTLRKVQERLFENKTILKTYLSENPLSNLY